jgi:2-oxo-4-hydroxy-4-carboxy--5-ureidoimidazoline (OHCU) decarboxylase
MSGNESKSLAELTRDPQVLDGTLSALFEPSPVLHEILVPSLFQNLQKQASALQSHEQLIDKAIAVIQSWDATLQAKFIAGHPRIGETKNLSAFSAHEQGNTSATPTTPPEVLARLAHLNKCYEHVYPGLRYITFVNGRSRATIAEEMEIVLGFEHSLDPASPDPNSLIPMVVGGEEWTSELKRAIVDVALIAKNRLNTFLTK